MTDEKSIGFELVLAAEVVDALAVNAKEFGSGSLLAVGPIECGLEVGGFDVLHLFVKIYSPLRDQQ